MTGALKDTGKMAVYRTQTGNIDTGNATITLRFAATSTKGKITFIVTVVIKPTQTTSTWKIASGHEGVQGLVRTRAGARERRPHGHHADRHRRAPTQAELSGG